MKSISRLLSLLILIVGLSGCIKNDIPYPVVKLYITSIEFDGQIGSAVIKPEDRVVTVRLDETVDLKNAIVKSVVLTDDARTDLGPGSVLDLTSPCLVELSFYQNYVWTIVGNQTIERRFVVNGQIGESVFDHVSKRAVTYISPQTDLSAVTITDLKLAPAGAVITPTDLLLKPQDFREPLQVDVQYKGVTERWTLFVESKESVVTTKSATPWVNVVWLQAESMESDDRGFEIRETNSTEWIRVDQSNLTFSGNSYSGRVPHLKAETAYVCRAYVDDNYGEELTFVTGRAVELPNGSLDNWHKNGKVWNPWLSGEYQFWDSGNKGASSMGESNTQPTSETSSLNPNGQAAKLESKFVGVGSLGKFAAGNLFAGEFVKIDGTNGILDFGKPFSTFPTKLRLDYKYTSSTINYVSSEFEALKGRPDSCFIWIAIGDWSEPVEIRTRPSNRKLFDKTDPHIIAYSEFTTSESTADYKELILELEYRALNRTPTYILVVASASKWGDYFTGGVGSTLWVDEMSLEYDY